MSAPASTTRFGGPLRESDYEKLLKESGIRREWIDRAQFQRVNDQQGRDAIGHRGTGDFSGILIPQFLPGESHAREYALRRDNPDVEYNSDGQVKQKRKYMFPPGRGNILYFLPATTAAQLTDKALPLLIVEGVKKALAAHQVAWDAAGDSAENPKYLSIALCGVWNWRGKIGKRPGPTGKSQNVEGPIPDLDRICWGGFGTREK